MCLSFPSSIDEPLERVDGSVKIHSGKNGLGDMANNTERTPEQIQALVKSGESKQFGAEGGNKTSGELGLSPASMRKNIRYFMRQTPKKNDKGMYEYSMPPVPTMAQILAAQELEAAANRSDGEHMRRVEYITDQTDGKLHQVNLNAGLAELEGKTAEELDAIERELDRRIANEGRADLPETTPPQSSPAGEGTHEGAAGTGRDSPIENL